MYTDATPNCGLKCGSGKVGRKRIEITALEPLLRLGRKGEAQKITEYERRMRMLQTLMTKKFKEFPGPLFGSFHKVCLTFLVLSPSGDSQAVFLTDY